jgi:hypothetical protein
MKQNEATIPYGRETIQVACDRHCHKAWGSTTRPSIQLSDDEDDLVYLADDELGDAPADPGTYEAWDAKPSSPDHFPNRWCVRACERCAMVPVGQEIVLQDWSVRQYNMPWLHESDMQERSAQ